MDLEAGTIIANHYEVVAKLGAGGMGEVYLVEDLALGKKQRALKLLHSHIADDTAIARFRQEMLLTSELAHEGIVKLYEFGKTEQGQHFITMEFVEGSNLKERLRTDGKVPFIEMLQILYYLAGALNHAHTRKIVHRDLKPDNVLLTKSGEIKLSDFGVARSLLTEKGLTATGDAVGTAYYMAPEQFAGKNVDHRADIYAFGILAYELATGKRPFDEPNFLVLSVLHLTQPLPKFAAKGSGIEPWFQDFVERCSAKRPEDRFQTIADAAEVLHEHLQAKGIAVTSVDVLLNASQHKRLVRRSFNKNVFKKFAVAILVGVFHMLVLSRHPTIPWAGWVGEAINLKTMDVWFKLRGQIEAPKDVVVISIDEESHDALGVSKLEPWPRRLTADLLDVLSKQHPKAVVLDFLYAERLEAATDSRFADSLTKLPVYLSKVLKEDRRTDLEGTREFNFEWMLPDPIFAEKAKGVFFAKVALDHFGVVRFFKYRNKYYFGEQPEEVLFKDSVPPFQLPGPEDFINFYGPPGSLRSVPIYKAIKNEAPSGYFDGKYVFVGVQLVLPLQHGAIDVFDTPLGQRNAGVEVIATTVANVLGQNWIKRFPIAVEAYCSLIFATLLAYAFFSASFQRALHLLVVVVVVVIGVSFGFLANGRFVPAVPLAASAILAFTLALGPMVRHLLPFEKIIGFGRRSSRN